MLRIRQNSHSSPHTHRQVYISQCPFIFHELYRNEPLHIVLSLTDRNEPLHIDLSLTDASIADSEPDEETPKAKKKRSKKSKQIEDAPVESAPAASSLPPVTQLLQSVHADFLQRGHIYKVGNCLHDYAQSVSFSLKFVSLKFIFMEDRAFPLLFYLIVLFR